MTADEFREIALSLAGAVEGAHGDHADFRAGGKVFASVGAPDLNWGMAKLTPEEQRSFMQANAVAFVPCTGAWGVRGYTSVRLANADAEMVRAALEAAHANATAATGSARPSRKAPSAPRRST